jgi:ribonuclease BN (tRNA processing enzyme)
MHLDHIYDLPILFLKRQMEQRLPRETANGTTEPSALHVYLPPGGIATIDSVLVAYGLPPAAPSGDSPVNLARYGMGDGAAGDAPSANPYGVVLSEYDPHASLAVGDLSVAFVGPTQHFPGECYAMRLTDPAGTLLAYTGDTSPAPIVAEIARDADCFLCEATMVETSDLAGQEARHMTGRAAGAYASEGHVGILVLTHFLSSSPEWLANTERTASETFSGPVTLAQIGAAITVAPAGT